MWMICVPIWFGLACPAGVATETDSAGTREVSLVLDVTNGTQGGAPVEADAVFVDIFKDKRLLRTIEGTVGADGKVVFEALPAGPGVFAVPRVRHQEMMFSGRVVALRAGEEQITAGVRVFDVCFDTSKLSVRAHHIIIKAQPKMLAFEEYVMVVNSSDMAVSSERRDNQGRPIILEMLLPEGFKNLRTASSFEEDAVVATQNGFYDTMAIPPGEYEFRVSYSLDIPSERLNIVRRFTLPTSSVVVFGELGQARIEGLGAPERATSPSGMEVEYYRRTGLAAGDELAFEITGFRVGSSGVTGWIVLAVVFGALLLVALARLLREKS